MDESGGIVGSGAYGTGPSHSAFVGQGSGFVTKDQVPRMHGGGDSVRIKHREYIGDISSTTGFQNRVYTCNPGLPATFPWLASIAANFEQYKFLGLAFEFVSTSADALNSTNTALGELIMTAEYNVTAPEYANLQQALNAMWSVSTKPSCNALAPVECSGAQNPLDIFYVRTGAVPAGQDARFFDLANMQIITNGSQAAAVVGQMWVTYDVMLMKPQLIVPYGDALESASYTLAGMTGAAPLNGVTTPANKIFDSIGLVVTDGGGIFFPIGTQGEWQILVEWTGIYCSHLCGAYAHHEQLHDLGQSAVPERHRLCWRIHVANYR